MHENATLKVIILYNSHTAMEIEKERARQDQDGGEPVDPGSLSCQES
jgi:hypothetical protein